MLIPVLPENSKPPSQWMDHLRINQMEAIYLRRLLLLKLLRMHLLLQHLRMLRGLLGPKAYRTLTRGFADTWLRGAIPFRIL